MQPLPSKVGARSVALAGPEGASPRPWGEGARHVHIPREDLFSVGPILCREWVENNTNCEARRSSGRAAGVLHEGVLLGRPVHIIRKAWNGLEESS